MPPQECGASRDSPASSSLVCDQTLLVARRELESLPRYYLHIWVGKLLRIQDAILDKFHLQKLPVRAARNQYTSVGLKKFRWVSAFRPSPKGGFIGGSLRLPKTVLPDEWW